MALTEENLRPGNFNCLKLSSGGGSGSVTHAGLSKVLRYDCEQVKAHIKSIITGSNERNTFLGLDNLKQAADTNVLREGQVIFGTVSLAHNRGEEGTIGWIYNLLSPLLLKLMTGQRRSFPYLHSSVYAGIFDGKHYVIENAGFTNEETRTGKISARTIYEAFEKESNFFVVSPPKDSYDKSTRYLVLQRALACLGVEYVYNMRAVSCETFVTALFGALEPKDLHPIQTEVLKPMKSKGKQNDRCKENAENFEKFTQDLINRIKMVPDEGTLLTLSYYLKRKETAASPWFEQMVMDYSQFFQAALSGDTKMCLDLLHHGLNSNTASDGSTAVEKALLAGHTDTAIAQIAAGADGRDALITSAQRGLTNSVKSLIASGAKIDYQGRDGCTALIRAAQNGCAESVATLIAAQASIELQDKYGDTALIKAAQKNQVNAITELIKAGAEIEHKNDNGYTALSMASAYGHTTSVRALIAEKVNINHTDIDGNTALILASQNGQEDTLAELIKAKATIDHQNIYRTTALMMAAERGSSAIISTLLVAGADIYKQDQYGRTAQAIAQQNGHISIVTQLHTDLTDS